MAEKPKKHRYGYRTSKHDIRDYHVRGLFTIQPLPVQFDFLDLVGSPYNQWEVGSCVAASLAKAMEMRIREVTSGYVNDARSIRWIYSQRPNAPQDGMEPRDGLDILLNTGCATEAECPYDEGSLANNPCTDPQTVADAATVKIESYARIYQYADAKQILFTLNPVVVAIPVYSNWNDASVDITGDIPDPPQGEQSTEGHQIFIVGWDDTKKRFIFINSWDDEFGVESPYGIGCGTISYQYVQSSIDQGIGESWTFVLNAIQPNPGPGPGPGPNPTPDCQTLLTNLGNDFTNYLTCIVSSTDPNACNSQLQTLMTDFVSYLQTCVVGQSSEARRAAARAITERIVIPAVSAVVPTISQKDWRGLFALVTLALCGAFGALSLVYPAAMSIFTFFGGITSKDISQYFFDHAKGK